MTHSHMWPEKEIAPIKSSAKEMADGQTVAHFHSCMQEEETLKANLFSLLSKLLCVHCTLLQSDCIRHCIGLAEQDSERS